jgi:GTP-binding protein
MSIFTFMQIRKAQYLISSPGYTLCPPPHYPEYAFIGRSNVGKSSLINMLCNQDKLAKTSSSPGKTQLINHFEIESMVDEGNGRMVQQKWYLVDLPGYGFAKVSMQNRKKWEVMIEEYLRKRENLAMVFVLIDARHEPQKIDLAFLKKLQDWSVPVTLVFTKTDKVNQRIAAQNMRLMKEAMQKDWQFLPQFIATSAVKKSGRLKLLGLLQELNESFEKD